MNKQTGFTLVELMVTLVVAAILLMVGVPSFVNTIRNNRVVSQTNQFVTALSLARSESLKLGRQVTVAKRGAEWEDGWWVFSDMDRDGVLDAGDGDTEIQRYNPLTDGYTLRTGAQFTDWIAYLPTGMAIGSGGGLPLGTFRLCPDDQDTAHGRNIVINALGRARVDEGATSCP